MLEKIKKLTRREKEIFYFLFTEKRMKEISYTFNLDNRTVDTYALGIYKKFGVSGRVGLILAVLQETKGVIPRNELDTAASDVLPSTNSKSAPRQ